jgi:hypothetical protein
MWYRFAIGAGMFLLGYTLGRGFKRMDEDARESRSTRIRDAVSSGETESGQRSEAERGPESYEDIVRE